MFIVFFVGRSLALCINLYVCSLFFFARSRALWYACVIRFFGARAREVCVCVCVCVRLCVCVCSFILFNLFAHCVCV